MHYLIYIFFLFFSQNISAKDDNSSISKKTLARLVTNEIYTNSNVMDFYINKTKKKKNHYQKFNLKMFGLHKKNCSIALSKISQYENYKNYIGFIDNLNYDKSKNSLYLKIDHLILPRPVIIIFEVDRLKKTGMYPFKITGGILIGLYGTIKISEYKNRCLFKIRANWEGQYFGFSSILFEMFSSTLTKIGLTRLFQMSQTY